MTCEMSRVLPGEILDSFYGKAIRSTRSGAIFNAHSYPTKINVAAAMPFIVAHTRPGDVVFDGFAGSGVSGLASALCERPDGDARRSVEDVLGSVAWGSRNCVLYDLSELACFISNSLLNPPDPIAFTEAANDVLRILESDWGWVYRAQDDASSPGAIRYTLWTDHPICPNCGVVSTYWDLAVSLSPPRMASAVRCLDCSHEFDVASAERLTEEYWDDLLGQTCRRRVRAPVFVYGRTDKSFWKRPISEADLELIERTDDTPVPPRAPIEPMLGKGGSHWGELYRAGYHFGITHVHHFYTRRNLIALASAWEATEAYPEEIQNALRFWISSYNASHSTLMTRVVCKKGAKDLVVTSAQPGALYIGSLPVEKNVFAGLCTKLRPVAAAFHKMHARSRTVTVHCASSLKVDMEDESVDYIFTDPPFGNNIQYSEVSFISEAWLRKTTNRLEEAIVSPHQGKSVHDYERLLVGAFAEAFRILKRGHYMTVVFHSTRPAVWDALRKAWESAGFQMVRSSILDKTQASFKQTTTSGAVRGDPVILLQKPCDSERHEGADDTTVETEQALGPWEVIADRLGELDDSRTAAGERTRQRLYSCVVRYYLEQGLPVPLKASSFFKGLDRHFKRDGDSYYLE